MNQDGLFHIWRRQAVLTIVLLIVTAVGAYAASRELPRTYQSDAQVLLLASHSAAKQNGGNPYLSFSPSLTLTADVISRELMAPGAVQGLAGRGYTSAYTVALAPYTTTTTGSVLLITVTGSHPAPTQHTMAGVIDQISTELAQLQGTVKPGNRIRATTLSTTPQAALSVAQTIRSVVAVIVVCLLFALGIPVVVDAVSTKRSRRFDDLLPDRPGSAANGRHAPDRASVVPQRQPAQDRWPTASNGGYKRSTSAGNQRTD